MRSQEIELPQGLDRWGHRTNAVSATSRRSEEEEERGGGEKKGGGARRRRKKNYAFYSFIKKIIK